jgi:hypothetical protein
MGLSSNILWHMTNREAFFSILKSQELKYSYSLERVIPISLGIAFPLIRRMFLKILLVLSIMKRFSLR